MTGVVSSRGLHRSWFLSVTVGECAGFAAPALTAALLSGFADRVFVPGAALPYLLLPALTHSTPHAGA